MEEGAAEPPPIKRQKLEETTESNELKAYFLAVPGGLEWIAIEELKEKIDDVTNIRILEKKSEEKQEEKKGNQFLSGKLYFETRKKPNDFSSKIRSADWLYAYVAEISGIPKNDQGLGNIYNIPTLKTKDEEWNKALNIWQEYQKVDKILFRVSGIRRGTHKYTSPEIGSFLGSALAAKYKWTTHLKQYNLDILADLTEDYLVLGICVSGPLYNRNRIQLVRTALKPSIAYCMLRLAEVEAGQVILDPMMGGGTIPLEVAQVYPSSNHIIGGDLNAGAIKNALTNSLTSKIPIEIFHWDARFLPLRMEASVDTVLSDIPFGMSCGNNKDNKKLYPALFKELGRVVKPGGKALIQTLEKNLLRSTIESSKYWVIQAVHYSDCGGYQVGIFVLIRTKTAYQFTPESNSNSNSNTDPNTNTNSNTKSKSKSKRK